MNVLFICKRYYTNKDLVADKFGRNFEFPVMLAENGHKVLVVALDYRGRKMQLMSDGQVQFVSLPLFSLSTLKGLIGVYQQIRSFSPTHIIGSGDSHIGYLAYRLAKNFGVFSVFDVYDHYLSFGSNRLPLMKRMFHQALRKSDLILSASRNLNTLALEFNQNAIVLENGVDVDRFKPLDKNACRQKLGLAETHKLVGYFGSMEPMRGVEHLILACRSLRRVYPDLKLLIAGKQSNNIDLTEEWIDYRGQVSQDQVVELINASDIVAIPYLRNPLVDFGNSCKIGEYLACEVPIVATQVDNLQVNYPEVIELLHEAIVPPGNSKELEKAIVRQLLVKQLVPCPRRIHWESLGEKLEKNLLQLKRG
jgi:glycosyltransferase involved in cell wall biosynthesis